MNDYKPAFLNSLILASIGLFAVSRRVSTSYSLSLARRAWFNEKSIRFLTYSKQSHPISAVTYILSHATPRHLAFNMVLLWSFGSQLVENHKVRLHDMLFLTSSSAIFAAFSERNSARPLVGSSGVVMGYLASLAVIDPNKTWIMIFPIPGVPLTSLQLLQACLVTHFALLVFNPFTRLALKGHLGGMLAGYIYSKALLPHTKSDILRDTQLSWNRSIMSAELVAYWIYLSLRLSLPTSFSDGADRGLLHTKRRFIERVWKEEY